MGDDQLEITITNWEKYNPRNDSKRPSWFRCENDFFTAQSTFVLTPIQKLVWLLIMCLASKKNSSTITLLISYASHMTGASEKEVFEAAKKLEQLQCLTINSHDPVRDSHELARTRTDLPATNEHYERTDERTDIRQLALTHPLIEIWNTESGTLPKARGLSPGRKKKCDALWKLVPVQDRRQYFVDVVKRIAQSRFCNGENEKNWVANFSWFLQSDVHLKAMEGTYDNRGASKEKLEYVQL